MMSRSGLLVLTSPLQSVLHKVSKVLTSASQHVRDVLYIHLAPELDGPDTGPKIQLPLVTCTPLVRQVVNQLYIHAASHHQHLDLRVILTNIGAAPDLQKDTHGYSLPCKLQFPYGVLLTDGTLGGALDDTRLLEYARTMFTSQPEVCLLRLSPENEEDAIESVPSDLLEPRKCYDRVCLGGTFDRIHAGHKILLSEALMICNQRLVVGMADGVLTSKKTLYELMQPCSARIQLVKDFLVDVKPQIDYHVVPITDAYGPSITESDLQCIVVSEETLKGGNAVNIKRVEKGFSELDVDVISLVSDADHRPEEEEKISSSSGRMRLLGAPIREIKPKPELAHRPYIIGLTGGIASGKSSVCKRLQGLGAAVVDCDKLGHKSYEPGAPANLKIVEAFGVDVVNSDGTINRRALGGKVFGSQDGLARLNDIVWPVIAQLAREEIDHHHANGVEVVLLDAAVLLEAGWDQICHEVWTAVIPEQEAVRRIVERNGLSEEESLKRIRSQMSNEERVHRAHVVFCTLWDYSVTQKQVEKAWGLLLKRLPSA